VKIRKDGSRVEGRSVGFLKEIRKEVVGFDVNPEKKRVDFRCIIL